MEELIKKHLEIKEQIAKLNNEDEAIKAEIKMKLKAECTDRYEDTSGNLVTYKTQTRETIDKAQVKKLLSDDMYKTVVKTTAFETLRITSKENREKAKSFIKDTKK